MSRIWRGCPAGFLLLLCACSSQQTTISADSPELATFVSLMMPRKIEIQPYLTQPRSFDNSGNATAVWSQSDGTRVNVWANRYVPGTGWETPTLIESENGPDAHSVHLAVDPSGDVTAVWATWDVWSNRYVPGRGWGTATIIGPEGDGSPYVATDASGNAIAVWNQSDGRAATGG